MSEAILNLYLVGTGIYLGYMLMRHPDPSLRDAVWAVTIGWLIVWAAFVASFLPFKTKKKDFTPPPQQ